MTVHYIATALTVPHVKTCRKTTSINTGMAIVVQLTITFRLPWSRGAYWWRGEVGELTGGEGSGVGDALTALTDLLRMVVSLTRLTHF